MNTFSDSINFEKLSFESTDLVLGWLDQPYIREFWDNSEEHRQDILSFVQGRTTPSPYFNGIFTYWIASIYSEPFAFLMTSPILETDDIPATWKSHIPKEGAVYGIDFCIGNLKYLGQGYAALTLKEFMTFFKKNNDSNVSHFFIDPDENNPKAVHVYQKAGFEEVSSFRVEHGYFENHTSKLMICRI